ncbi:MAG TPA: bifunctional hydroxymethylpyrimidine kinase/phosphomethylpyrimidine kinase [Vicinamibacterales bacterium]|nr:bifunctional hydroxymethylpyrimidine kinase/phosphomethylpyrimidine kinase [Vicinamibacterales bacterium]
MRTALTIAGSDSGGGAGIQADLKTFAAYGVYGASAITAVTAQNTTGVVAVAPLEADLVTLQIETVAGDLVVHATKVGMLATAAIVEAVAAAIEALDLPLVVVDPVIAASTGDRLLEADAVQALCAELLPLARVVTPNIPEAEVLSGVRIRSLDDAHEAAKRIRDLGPRAVVITGGHSGIAHSGSRITDLLLDGDDWHEYTVARVDSPPLHGTGCTYASAIAAGLALRRGLPEAAEDAQQYVAGAIRSAVAVGRGRVPVNHFWRLRT